MSVDYALVLTALFPESQWTLNGDDYSGLVWDESNADSKPTKKTLDGAWPQVDYDNQYAAVAAARRARYQAETDGLYFEAMRGDGDLTAWTAAVNQIRADLPKPTA